MNIHHRPQGPARARHKNAKAEPRGISIRDLQKMSAERIERLPHATPVKSGGRTVGLLIPFRKPDPKRLAAVLKRAQELAKRRDPAEDDAALIAMGIDPTNYSKAVVRAIQKEWLALKP